MLSDKEYSLNLLSKHVKINDTDVFGYVKNCLYQYFKESNASTYVFDSVMSKFDTLIGVSKHNFGQYDEYASDYTLMGMSFLFYDFYAFKIKSISSADITFKIKYNKKHPVYDIVFNIHTLYDFIIYVAFLIIKAQDVVTHITVSMVQELLYYKTNLNDLYRKYKMIYVSR